MRSAIGFLNAPLASCSLKAFRNRHLQQSRRAQVLGRLSHPCRTGDGGPFSSAGLTARASGRRNFPGAPLKGILQPYLQILLQTHARQVSFDNRSSEECARDILADDVDTTYRNFKRMLRCGTLSAYMQSFADEAEQAQRLKFCDSARGLAGRL